MIPNRNDPGHRLEAAHDGGSPHRRTERYDAAPARPEVLPEAPLWSARTGEGQGGRRAPPELGYLRSVSFSLGSEASDGNSYSMTPLSRTFCPT